MEKTMKKTMKKTNNGFSLVELIIVIAIMAILAGAIAPALIRYIDKSRKSNDISAGKTIKTAVETALSYEKTFELMTTGNVTTINDVDGRSITYAGSIEITPNTATSGTGAGITLHQAVNADQDAQGLADTKVEIGNNIGEHTPKIRYKKAANGSLVPTEFVAFVSAGGNIVVGVGASTSSGDFYQLAPEISKYYN